MESNQESPLDISRESGVEPEPTKNMMISMQLRYRVKGEHQSRLFVKADAQDPSRGQRLNGSSSSVRNAPYSNTLPDLETPPWIRLLPSAFPLWDHRTWLSGMGPQGETYFSLP